MPRPGSRAPTRGSLSASAALAAAPLALLLATLALAGPAAAQQIGPWTPSIGAFGHWTWGLPRADEATIEALNPSPPRCYQAVAEGTVCCSTGAAWVCGGAGGGACALAGDVDGDCSAADLDEAAVRDELEAVLRLAELQGDLPLGTKTSGGYAASATEGGPATTALALDANGPNCSAGSAPLGVDASGAVEGCYDVATQAEQDAIDLTLALLANLRAGEPLESHRAGSGSRRP